MASFTASFTALVVMVAPATPSTSADWASTILAGISSSTLPPSAGVSSAPVRVTSTILPSDTVIFASIWQNIPCALPVYTVPSGLSVAVLYRHTAPSSSAALTTRAVSHLTISVAATRAALFVFLDIPVSPFYITGDNMKVAILRNASVRSAHGSTSGGAAERTRS